MAATRHNLFLYALWQDALVKHLDLTARVRYDALDDSRLQWLEARSLQATARVLELSPNATYVQCRAMGGDRPVFAG